MMKKRTSYFFVVLIFSIGVVCGIVTSQHFLQSPINMRLLANPTPKHCAYTYVNPLRCEPDLASRKKEYISLKNDLTENIAMVKKDGAVTDIAVYFRDLENGPFVNINGEMNFEPASLMKVPLMVTYLKKAQSDPAILQEKVIAAGDFQFLPEQEIRPQKSAKPGETYTREELISLMITQSDNYAWLALLNDLHKKYSDENFVSTLSDLGIIDPRISIDGQFLNAQSYAAIFRLLYNSSYLNIPMSDKALKLLTQTNFQDGIVSGLPKGIKVAHKFGETNTDGVQEIHDCGIVYYHPDPYILCIMTKGHDILTLEQVIQQLSKEVYQAVQQSN